MVQGWRTDRFGTKGLQKRVIEEAKMQLQSYDQMFYFCILSTLKRIGSWKVIYLERLYALLLSVPLTLTHLLNALPQRWVLPVSPVRGLQVCWCLSSFHLSANDLLQPSQITRAAFCRQVPFPLKCLLNLFIVAYLHCIHKIHRYVELDRRNSPPRAWKYANKVIEFICYW